MKRTPIPSAPIPSVLIILCCVAAGMFGASLLTEARVHAQSGSTVPAPESENVAALAPVGRIYMPLVGMAVGMGEEPASAMLAEPQASGRRLHLPFVQIYQPIYRTIPSIPIAGGPIDRPAAVNGDVNLALRGYAPTNAVAGLIDIGGPTDSDAPQLAAMFSPARKPVIAAVYRVNEWDWACGAHGCRGNAIAYPPVTMIALATVVGEKIHLPSRSAEIYGGGYKALVLYADERRITLKYTREDSPVWGYMIHLEEIGVDPALVLRYRELNAAGRGQLPALKNGDLVGYAIAPAVKVAVRDTGMFMDPRTRKDWWKGY